MQNLLTIVKYNIFQLEKATIFHIIDWIKVQRVA